jgi:hypothetical protein
MGLLDDAIREHLELRRRHGADPGEVMSKEHEALGPAEVRPRGALSADAGDDALPVDTGGNALFTAHTSMTAEDRRHERRERRERRVGGQGADDPCLSQETVELDMRALLDADADASTSVGPARGGMRSMTSAAPVRALR